MTDHKIKAQKTTGMTLEVEVPRAMTLHEKVDLLTAAYRLMLYGPATRAELKLDQADTDIIVTTRIESRSLE